MGEIVADHLESVKYNAILSVINIHMNNQLIEGKIIITGKGLGFLKDPENGKDISIESIIKLNRALNNDKVRVKILSKSDDLTTGEVIEIISRDREQFVGTVKLEAANAGASAGEVLIIPDNRRIHVNFILDKADVAQIANDQKVLVKLDAWEKEAANPTVKLLKIFGQKGEHEVEMQSIIYEKGFQSEFPAKIEAEAEALKKVWSPIPADEIAKRRDMREADVMTIDPIDAKDFDDALHIKKLDDGNFEVGVHIADVSHYVTPGSELDKESADRAFSVYLVDRTIPMLPEVLSNDLCSLNPLEEKLAFSAVFKMNANGDVLDRWFGKTVIKSKKRFSYEEAQAVLDAEAGPFVEELQTLNSMAKKMATRKKAAGAIEFEKDEIKFELDKDGRPIRVIKKARMDTHKLVEEFMLLANKEVAKYMYEQNKNFGGNNIGLMYRVHDVPNPERIADLAIFLKALGYNLPIDEEGDVTAQDLNNLLMQVTGKPEETLIKTATVRTMSKAIYSPINTGHFGLAFDYYTHFTSPIRRYPDLLVHRIVFSFLQGKQMDQKTLQHLENSAVKSSQREVSAAEAERESIKYKQAEFMQDHLGEAFDGIISGVTKWGLYVVLNDTLSEGMIHISKLGNDFFTFDEKKYAVVGERTGKKYTLGDPIKVKIEKIDLDKKAIDMTLVEESSVEKK
jgi:ribonuclease R